ncbi:MAG: endonuclease domain-containing protein [Sulfuricaulis sp.]|nr:endonuclease domain-containing protein [Sulfuricaulis sp.]
MSKHSPEMRAKISAALKGRPKSLETRAKMSAAFKGRMVTPKQRAKISATLKGRQVSASALENMKQAQQRRTPEHQARLDAAAKTSRTPETRAKISATLKDQLSTPEARAAISERMKGKISDAAREKMRALMPFYVQGGQTAEDFASVLCPVGFIREYRIQWGETWSERFQLDFAHLEGKVCIELDGPHHKKIQEYDAMRDALLRAMGWRVIRIRHERFGDEK